jgi:hypothetical protein
MLDSFLALWHQWYGKALLATAGGLLIWLLDFSNKRKQGRLLAEQIRGQKFDNEPKEERSKIDKMKTELLRTRNRAAARLTDPNTKVMLSAGPDDDAIIFQKAMAELRSEHPDLF